VSIFADHMILYVDKLKYLEKAVRTANKFNKAARHKISIQNTVVVLYSNNEITEKEIKKAYHSQ
jgi:hypothetical protein